MGYDYDITCKHCDQTFQELYTSYNHSWAFYEYLDKKQGLRWIYGKTGRVTVKRLETMLECLESYSSHTMNFETAPELGDGWAPTVGNAYWFAKKILETAKKHPRGVWSGD